MKTSRFALVLTLLLAIAGNVPADARPMGHFGTSSGLKSGFSSQKGNAFRSARPSAPMAAPSSAPGAFGAAAAGSAARGASPLSRDLEQSAAQANATRTLDARRAAAPPASTIPPQADPLRPQPAPGAYYPQMPQPVYVQRHDSGWMPMWMGFMLGRSLSGGHQTVYYANNYSGDPNNGGNAGGGNNGAPVGSNGAPIGSIGNNLGSNGAYASGGEDWDRINPAGATVGANSAATVAVPQHSFGDAVLRALAWLAFLSTMFWVLRVIFKRMLRNRAAANYSFERN